MNKILVYLMIIFLSMKWMFRITIGDKIYYKGKIYQVTNGVCPTTWTLNSKFRAKRIECQKIWSLKGTIRSFQSGYSFYMGYWYSIWVNVGIESWMQRCQIW